MPGDLKKRFNLMTKRNIFIFCFLVVTVSCKNSSREKIVNLKPGTNEMTQLNRYFVQKDKERIKNYIERKNLEMTESPTGLWFQIINPGLGTSFTEYDRVLLNYDCSLLDGTKCYSSEIQGPKELVLGRSEMEPETRL
jgi:FKBP-type peptidyl-prolyl cis-trans isomerase